MGDIAIKIDPLDAASHLPEWSAKSMKVLIGLSCLLQAKKCTCSYLMTMVENKVPTSLCFPLLEPIQTRLPGMLRLLILAKLVTQNAIGNELKMFSLDIRRYS
ncbi:hypothetical protein ACH5RR_012722 [Cinchona calisaya]|uniref:Uncharacterized protein n=1 Tax=Cinchona calisaya TaxID=153742 RepID=A0ABD3A8I9_9GENT